MTNRRVVKKILETINNQVEELKGTSEGKNRIMSLVLKLIMGYCGVGQKDYMILAGYGLKCIRPTTDIDVGVKKGAFDKIKKKKIGEMSIAKIGQQSRIDQRIVIKIPEIDKDAEIEIFEHQSHGFPLGRFSITNLSKKNSFTKDEYGNQYYNVQTLADFYSCVKKRNDEYYWGELDIKKERFEKNLKHLTLLYEHLQKCKNGDLSSEELEVCDCLGHKNDLKYLKNRIDYLKSLL